MIFNDYDVVISKKKLSEKVNSGCKGAILICYENNDYEVEFVDKHGESLEVLTVAGEDLSLADT